MSSSIKVNCLFLRPKSIDKVIFFVEKIIANVFMAGYYIEIQNYLDHKHSKLAYQRGCYTAISEYFKVSTLNRREIKLNCACLHTIKTYKPQKYLKKDVEIHTLWQLITKI